MSHNSPQLSVEPSSTNIISIFSYVCDKRLFKQDIEGSLAHVKMLGMQGILTKEETDKITDGLVSIRKDVESGVLAIDESYEDIHSFVEAVLTERIGRQKTSYRAQQKRSGGS